MKDRYVRLDFAAPEHLDRKTGSGTWAFILPINFSLANRMIMIYI